MPAPDHPSTLIRPPPVDPSKSAIENVLELTQLVDIDANLYTNTRQLWHPAGARGIYGGAVIAQCLSAAQRTVPDNFTIHSMHCYFVLAGNAEIPIIYHVEHVRDGKSFVTRTVQARQRAKPIFTTTMSFVREGAGGKEAVQHAVSMANVPLPLENKADTIPAGGDEGPFVSQKIHIENYDSPDPGSKKTRQWIKARGQISPDGGHKAHLSALAYMSDSYFIGTVARVHRLLRRNDDGKPRGDEDFQRKIREAQKASFVDGKSLKESGHSNQEENNPERRRELGMMVSLDHTIYFHRPREFRADEWMFTEMDSPWAGDGRGLVMQRMYTKDGKLIATCVQEGVVRLRQTTGSKL